MNIRILLNDRSLRLSVAAVALALAACSTKVGSDAPEFPGFGKPEGAASFAHKTSGPALDGEWLSSCVRDKWNFQATTYEQIRIAFNGQNVRRETVKYSDPYCQTSTSRLNGAGLFRYAKDNTGGRFEIEYQLQAGSRGFPGGDVVRRDGPRMWMSNGYLGPAVEPDIDFRLQAPRN